MARTRTTLRRIDPWSMLKFGFVVNLVLLGVELLLGLVLWYVVQRLGLIETVCGLAESVGFEDCGLDGGALFDTFLLLGLLGVVIQTGIVVFMTFLANLIFDLVGGIAITLDDGATGSSSSSSVSTGASRVGSQMKKGVGSLGTLLSRGDGDGDDGKKGVAPSSHEDSSTKVTSGSGSTWPGDRPTSGGSSSGSTGTGLFGDD